MPFAGLNHARWGALQHKIFKAKGGVGVEFKNEEIPAEKISEFNVGGIARLWPEGVHSVECRVSQRFVLLLLDWAPESFMFQIRRRMETREGRDSWRSRRPIRVAFQVDLS